MNTRRNQVIALVALCVIWAGVWFYNEPFVSAPSIAKAEAAKAAAGDKLLMDRFYRVRAKIDALYHYRVRPALFDPAGDPFRNSGYAMPAVAKVETASKAPERPEELLMKAVDSVRVGGVVIMNGDTQLTIDGQLHKEGDVLAAHVGSRLVLLRIKYLSTYIVTLTLDDSEAGTAETTVRLK